MSERFREPEDSAERRQGTWRNADNDRPVVVLGSYGIGPDGREYLQVEGSGTGIPADEFVPAKAEEAGSISFRLTLVIKRIREAWAQQPAE